MLAKLALRNVRRSVRDYAIYFVTLLFGVAVFYAFNSIQSQQVLFDLKESSSANVFEMTGMFMGIFSVVVACVLGFLILYANRFLIRRRKQEFGTYLMLGMRPRSVSFIVLLETLLVGVVSLVAGLALGVALSQGLSFATAALFNTTMQEYRFIFSINAFMLTLACFAAIYVVVALFNTITIRRCKLIDLLSARAKQERGRVRNPWVCLVVFIVALATVAASYYILIQNGLLDFNEQFWLSTALMLVGTLMLFWSLAGFVIAIIQRTRGVYFRGLTMFTVRQIATKINTAFLSLWVVCILLFLSITVFSGGMGLVNVFMGGLEEGTVFDATIISRMLLSSTDTPEGVALVEEARSYGFDIDERMKASNPEWDSFVADKVQVDVYTPKEGTDTYGEIMSRLDIVVPGSNEYVQNTSVVVIGVSQFNALRALSGNDPIDVGQDGYAVNNNVDMGNELSEAMAKAGTQITVAGHALTSAQIVVHQTLQVSYVPNEVAEVIVPDWIIEGLLAQGEIPDYCYLSLNYNVGRVEGDALLGTALASLLPPTQNDLDYGFSFNTEPWPVTTTFSAQEAIDQAVNYRMMLTYLAVYIGFVFLITTAAVLAIQQLSETSDSLARYRMLAELGCDRRMVFGSLRSQVMVYFLVPLVVAVCHSVCAVGVLNTSLFSALGVSIGEPSLMAAALVTVVYGGYLLVAYSVSRGLVRTSLGKKLLG